MGKYQVTFITMEEMVGLTSSCKRRGVDGAWSTGSVTVSFGTMHRLQPALEARQRRGIENDDLGLTSSASMLVVYSEPIFYFFPL